MRKLAAGNWKMNGLQRDGLALAAALARKAKGSPVACDLLVCPPATLLRAVGEALRGSGIALGGQDCHAAAAGAHTGDVSAPMLADAGCRFVILGHSERRADHHESDGEIRAKILAARAAGLAVILCVGESEAERGAGRTLDIIGGQLAGSLPTGQGAAGLDGASLAIAYEPVWAIGSGRTPTLAEVAEVHGHLRSDLKGRVPDPAAVRLLYGGSVKPDNAVALMAVPDVDGALVGGASLSAEDFWRIAEACGGA